MFLKTKLKILDRAADKHIHQGVGNGIKVAMTFSVMNFKIKTGKIISDTLLTAKKELKRRK